MRPAVRADECTSLPSTRTDALARGHGRACGGSRTLVRVALKLRARSTIARTRVWYECKFRFQPHAHGPAALHRHIAVF
eukprot:6182216-Pleurochrysis_carterae.AAC.3